MDTREIFGLWTLDGRRSRRQRGDEAVAAPVHGLNEVRLPGVIAQRLAQLVHTHHQHRLAHRHLRPRRREQFVFAHHLPGMRHEMVQYGQRLRAQEAFLLPAPQLAAAVKVKWGERHHLQTRHSTPGAAQL
jgi:hypothetical protein